MKSALELQIDELRASLETLAERVRLDAVAEAFLRGDHEIRKGDYFELGNSLASRLVSVSSEGKWTYFDGHGTVEPFRIPAPGDYDRLYTIAEVAEIVAKATALGKAR